MIKYIYYVYLFNIIITYCYLFHHIKIRLTMHIWYFIMRGKWNFEELAVVIPPKLRTKMMTDWLYLFRRSRNPEVEDVILWAAEILGKYVAKSGYKWLLKCITSQYGNWGTRDKYWHLVWLVLRGSPNERNVQPETSCSICEWMPSGGCWTLLDRVSWSFQLAELVWLSTKLGFHEPGCSLVDYWI